MKRLMSILIACSLLLAAGCSMHERTAPDAANQRVSDLAGETTEDVRPTVDWWLAFEDETLNRLVEQALNENATIDQAAAGVRKAEAFLAGQKAADLPGVNLTGSAGRARTEGFMGGVSSSWELSLGATYELDLWGKRQALKKQRVLDRDASLAALSSAMVSVSARVADTWYLLLEQKAQVALAEERVAMRKERLELVALRYGQGTVIAGEVYAARSELAAEEAILSGYRADASVAGNALAVLVNRKPGSLEVFQPGTPLSIVPEAPPLADQDLSSRLILGRPDMVQALKQVEKADEAVAVSLADRFPSFSLTAGYGRAGYDYGDMSGSGPVWNVGGNLLAPLLDWGGRKSMVEADRAAFDESLAGYRNAALAAFNEAADALTRYQNGELAVAQLEDSLKAATSNTADAKSRYLEGISDYLTLLSIRIAENEAGSRLVTNRRLLLSHRISLARALGGSFSDAWSEHYAARD